MILSLLSFIALTVSGMGCCRVIARRANITPNIPIEVGVGFFIAAAATGLTLSVSWLPVSQTSYIILMVICVAAVSTVLLLRSKLAIAGKAMTTDIFLISPINFLLLIFILGYLLLVLANNITWGIFPWDAFTTWMFRAKAWVTTDTISEFVSLREWVGTTSGFTLPAAHYPISISAIAAFSSALSGEWSGQAASIPWFFAMLASAMIMGGLCHLQAPNNPTLALAGTALLVTAPLVHLHGMLAGYADIWVMGTSGMGLAGICLWTQQRSSSTLAMSVVLLVLGCLWKQEGWLWLIAGGLVALPHWLWQRFAMRGLISLVLLFALLWTLQPLNLGPFGVWGMDNDRLSAGVLGSFGTRPYNPIVDYFDMTVLRGNFLLITPLYLLALAVLSIHNHRRYTGYILTALYLVGIHGVIFGLSGYSRYAEAGTALNRLLLQSLPVLIVTITAALHLAIEHQRTEATALTLRRWPNRLMTGAIVTLVTILSLPLTLGVFSQANKPISGVTMQAYPASDLRAVVGTLEKTLHGYQFKAANVPIGVAAIPLPETPVALPRYLVIESWMDQPESLSVYWINGNEPRVHSAPLTLGGHSIVDMATYADFWQQPIQEMGFLVQPEHFNAVAIERVALTDSLFDALPALLHHWASPAALSHRLINTTTGHTDAPVTLHSWLAVALTLMCLLGLCWRVLVPTQSATVTNGIIIGIGVLWLAGSSAHINQSLALRALALWQTSADAQTLSLDGSHLLPLAESIKRDPALSALPILTMGLDQESQFAAQRLPYMLLPTSAAATSERKLTKILGDFSGTVLILATDETRLRASANVLAGIATVQILTSGPGYLMLSTASQ